MEYRWLTPLSQQFLERDYLKAGQTVHERVTAICENAERILGKPGFAARFQENFAKGWYSFSTPIWANFGEGRGLPISCFGSSITDSMEGILEAHAEVGMMTKFGGGTSGYFGDLRHRGAPIKDNGQSFGSVHFMQMFDQAMNIISQGSTRRGSFAGYLPIWHKDIEEFLTIRSEGSPIQDMSFGVCVPDDWMQSMIDGDADKRKIWARVLQSRANTGYPYIFFSDNANSQAPDVYQDKGLEIRHTNLCVTGDQLVVTSKGMKTVLDLYQSGENLTLFDGENKVSASPMRLIEKSVPVFKITTSSGRTHRVTDYHKVKTNRGMVAAKDLQPGDRVAIQRNKGLFGQTHEPEAAFLLGLYHGDGTGAGDLRTIDLWENDFDLIPEVNTAVEHLYAKHDFDRYVIDVPGRGPAERLRSAPKMNPSSSAGSTKAKMRLGSSKLRLLGFDKGNIPSWLWEGDEQTQWQYLRGLYYADGTVSPNSSNGDPVSLVLASIDREHLSKVQIMLSNLGIKSQIYVLREAGAQLLPDGRGGTRNYETKTCYRLVITNKKDALSFEKNTGFLSRKGMTIDDREYRDNTKKFDTVVSIEPDGIEDVYCTTVDTDEHVWVCNSFITSNCSEIMLPNGPDESFVCDLSSMNMLYYDEWKDTDAVELMVYFLDAVMTEFIEKAKNIPFMARPVRFAERHRAIGIGWLGWHSLLQSKMLPWESDEAKALNLEAAKLVKEQAYAASAKMVAEGYAEPDLLKGYGRRHATLLAIAPTKSSAFILGQVSEGIEPERANIFIKDLAKGKYTIKNRFLEKLLEEKGQNTADVWEKIMKNKGSVANLDFLTPHEKAVFKTFREINPQEIIIQAADRQKYVDQGQSLNLMISPTVPIKDVNKLYIDAWKLGIKSLYYQISVNAAQEFSRELTCEACEA